MIRIESSIYLDFERRILNVFKIDFFTKIFYKLNFNDLNFFTSMVPGIEFSKKLQKLGLSTKIP
jgi:hypothetical protein